MGIVILVLLCSSLVVLVEAASMWSQTYGGTEYDMAYSLVSTFDGGYTIAGATQSFGAGDDDFWLVKTGAFGNIKWNKTYGGTGADAAYSLVAASDGGYAMAGDTYSFGAGNVDFWLVKTDANGVMEWNRTYGGTEYDSARSLVAASDGGYAIAGWTNSSGAGDADVFLVKTDAFGNMQWNRTYGGSGSDVSRSLVALSDGGYIMTGWTTSFGVGNTDFWLVKTDALGNMRWNRTYGGPEYEFAYSLVAASDGGYALTGWTDSFGAGNSDFWLLKTDGVGNMEWNRTYGETLGQFANSLVVTSDGGYGIAGNAVSPDPGLVSAWFVKTDANGVTEWNRTYGGAGFDEAYSVITTSDGGYAIVGSTSSFGAGGADFWLIKTDETGVVPEYSSWLIPALVLTTTAFILINKKKLLHTRS